ncbi:phage tail tape measure protein, partial [Salmonella enterica subsp. enterica serovar Infantis]
DSAQSWEQADLATREKLNIAPDGFRFAQNMIYSVEKSGGGSVAEQTQWINAFAVKTGAQGKEGFAELTETMKIAMKNAPD